MTQILTTHVECAECSAWVEEWAAQQIENTVVPEGWVVSHLCSRCFTQLNYTACECCEDYVPAQLTGPGGTGEWWCNTCLDNCTMHTCHVIEGRFRIAESRVPVVTAEELSEVYEMLRKSASRTLNVDLPPRDFSTTV